MSIDSDCRQRLRAHLELLYPGKADDILPDLVQHVEAASAEIPQGRHGWDQTDAVLITYGDQVSQPGQTTLAALGQFLIDRELADVLSAVHILPFFPYSSDDGFSVIDYRRVDPALGDWPDVARLGERFDMMFDLVINHCSQHSEWFQKYLEGVEPYTSYFIDLDADTDVSQVTRPRSHPLLSAYDTSRGTRHVWTTFSADQVDLNFGAPAVLLEMLDILLFYIRHGARIIRLDAIAYLWKRLGTTCIHLPETHEVVKLMRTLCDAVAPGTILLTETNVPHEENVSYYGDGDEAQMVYQFSLAPLLLEALLTGDATVLHGWLASLELDRPGTTVFNFTASHDGIGVRPLEGIMPPDRFDSLVDAVRQRGGHVSMKRNTDGSESPYELNITYFDALADPDTSDTDRQVRRFLAGQTLMVSLKGIPGIYFHSLVGTPNNHDGVAETGRARTINRKKFDRAELDTVLDQTDSPQARVLDAYRRVLAIRREQPAFHPDASQHVLATEPAALVAFLRENPDVGQRILVAANLGPEAVDLNAESLAGSVPVRDLLAPGDTAPTITLAPYQVAWLEL